jgi:hypothetical protein
MAIVKSSSKVASQSKSVSSVSTTEDLMPGRGGTSPDFMFVIYRKSAIDID